MSTQLVISVTDELVAELEALASKATGGEWEYHMGLIRTMQDSDGYVPVAVAPNCPKNWRGQRDTNMHYIATANPATILAMLAERAELKRDAERFRHLMFYHVEWQQDGKAKLEFGPYPEQKLRATIDAAMQSEAKP